MKRTRHRLPPVFRALATIVAVAMLSVSATATMQHVHAYTDHDHAEHHHGPASHEHTAVVHLDHSDPGIAADAARLEGCEPGAHAVSVVFTCVAPQPNYAPAPIELEMVITAPPEQACCHVTPSEVRAHSPPRLTDAPLRAPPLVHPA